MERYGLIRPRRCYCNTLRIPGARCEGCDTYCDPGLGSFLLSVGQRKVKPNKVTTQAHS